MPRSYRVPVCFGKCTRRVLFANRKRDLKMACLALILLYIASAVAKEACNSCIKVNTTCYNVEHIINLPVHFRTTIVIHKMAVLDSENTLFFSYEPEIVDPEFYKVGYVNLDDPTKHGILSHDNNAILNFGTFGIDQEKSIVYLGGSNGIFTYGPSKKVMGYSSIGDKIRTLFFKDKLYIVKASDEMIIAKMGDAFVGVLNYTRIKDFVVNNDNVVVFLSNYGLFLSKTGGTPVFLSKNAFFRGLTVDLDGVVYAWWIDGIYKVVIEKNIKESTVTRVAELENIGAMTFDNINNMYFTSGSALYRLRVSNATVC